MKQGNIVPYALGLLLVFAGTPLFAEHEFALRLAPAFQIPAGQEHFGPGVGAAAALEWAPLQFPAAGELARRFSAGLSAGGGFGSFSVEAGGAFSFFEGGAGPFARWRPFDRWTFGFDLRFGAYQYQWDTYSNTRFMASGILGADFHLSPYFSLFAQAGYALYSFTEKPLNAVNMAVGLRLNLSEIMSGRARVRGETTDQRRIFPVSFAWYEDNPVASLRITNSEPNAVTDITLSFFMDRYMSQPAQFAVLPRLAPGETAEVPVTALFNEVMLSLTENVNAYGQIQMQYRSLGAKKEAVMQVQMPIYHRNAMSWDDDRRAASFVSPRDSSARLFARYVGSTVDSAAASPIPQNVRYAAALFETLRLYGINYTIDPASSFIELSENASALDSLNYPYQTLFYRGGDCDDLSILFSSLLEVLGVETAFITIPGHIYMAFDVGDDKWLSGSADIIVLNGRRWLPVEITIPADGFTLAWRAGAREWRNAGTEAMLYPMHASWEIYPSVSVPGAAGRMPILPRTADILQALDVQQRALTERGNRLSNTD